MSGKAQTMLISGTSRGLGKAMAEHFLACGWLVFGCARSSSSLTHDAYQHFCCDVTSSSEVNDLIAAVRREAGSLDVLVNNAGAARMLPFALTPPETARRIMDVNYHSTFNMTHAAVRLLRRSARPRVINLSTVAVPWRLEGEAAYVAAKAAVEALTKVTARELGAFGITCNAIGASPIRTDLLSKVPEDKLDALIARQSIRRWASAEDVINLVEFFCRPESGMVTGQVVYLGGAG